MLGSVSIAFHKSSSRSRDSIVSTVSAVLAPPASLGRQFDLLAAMGGAAAIDGEPPGHSRQPGAEPVPIAKLPEVAIGLREGLLRDVLGILAMPQHAVGDAERQRRGLDEAGLELAVQLVIHPYEAANQPVHALMHRIAFIVARRRRAAGGSVSGAGGRARGWGLGELFFRTQKGHERREGQDAKDESACGHAEPRPSKAEARHQRKFALGVGPQRQ